MENIKVDEKTGGLDDIMVKINEDLFKVIYTTYKSEIHSIFLEYCRQYGKIKYTSFSKEIDNLIASNLIKKEHVNLGSKGNLKIILITKEGQHYLKSLNIEPIEREAEEFLRVHSSLNHAYLIKHIYNYFLKNNIRIKENMQGKKTFLNKNEYIEPDLFICINRKWIAVEVETGKNTKSYFFKKLNKASKVFDRIILFYPNQKETAKATKYIEDWRSKNNNYTFEILVLNINCKKSLINKIKTYIK